MRIFQKLFLLLSLTAMLSAFAVAGMLSWNLQRGFSDYLDARDTELIDDFVDDFEEVLLANSNNSSAEIGPELLQASMEELARQGRIPELRPSPDEGRRVAIEKRDRPLLRQNAGGSGERGPPPAAFGRRLRLFDTRQEQVFGPPPGPAQLEARAMTRPIMLNGRQVATVKLLERGATPQAIDASFLRSQYVGILSITVALLALSGLLAWRIAKRGSQQIEAVQRTTRAIANGEFGTRIEESGKDEVAALGADINTMAESLGRLESARRRWLAEISHELRTPLTVLKGEIEAIRDGIRPLKPEAMESLSEEVNRLDELIEDLHFLAISDLGSSDTNLSHFDGLELVREVVARFARSIEQAGLKLEMDFGQLSVLNVNWDRHRIEQLLSNLITNSIRYTDAPGSIFLSVEQNDDLVCLTVEDTAPSVRADQCEKLFEPLHRLEEARDRNSGGSGLGLSVAQAIVASHKGSIKASPSPHEGLKISAILPKDASV